MSMPETASQLYARSQGYRCEGPLECHYCGSPCSKQWTHDDPAPIPFKRSPVTCKRPGSLYICHGCKIWRRKKATVFFLDGTLKDGKEACDYSWWITDHKALALNPHLRVEENKAQLYELLLKPPGRFCLSLIEPGVKNLLQLAVMNHIAEVKPTTELAFTLNNVVYRYTVQQLEMALHEDEDRRKRSVIPEEASAQGKEPGVLALVSLLGSYDIPWRKQEEKRGPGRPRKVREE